MKKFNKAQLALLLTLLSGLSDELTVFVNFNGSFTLTGVVVVVLLLNKK